MPLAGKKLKPLGLPPMGGGMALNSSFMAKKRDSK